MDINLSFIENSYFLKKLENYLDQLFRSTKNVEGILLFGSLARGNAVVSDEKFSDIDLLVIFSDKELPVNHNERTNIQIKLMGLTGTGFDSIWMTESEFKNAVKIKSDMILSGLNEGIVLFDPNGLINGKKNELFAELKNKGVIKRKNYWMWPLKYLGEEIEW